MIIHHNEDIKQIVLEYEEQDIQEIINYVNKIKANFFDEICNDNVVNRYRNKWGYALYQQIRNLKKCTLEQVFEVVENNLSSASYEERKEWLNNNQYLIPVTRYYLESCNLITILKLYY